MTDYFKNKCPLFDAGLTPGDFLRLNNAGTKIQTSTSTSELNSLGNLASDPSTAGWGDTEQGTFWFNTTEKKFKGWNGSAIILLG